MFKLFFVYPFVALIIVWLASDTQVGASVYDMHDNYISLEFPRASLRSAENPEPWYSFYWNADSAQEGLKKINDAVVKHQ
ncbi:hypothetical protein [Psychromonas sp.]|uniref:hypothetical protein n=1 Tax=Psychromonas sp. TaxID=1884585 RepID=UPI00356347E0